MKRRVFLQRATQRFAVGRPQKAARNDDAKQAAVAQQLYALLHEVCVKVGNAVECLVHLLEIVFEVRQRFLPNVRRIPDHRVEPAGLHDPWELGVPVEDVDAVAFVVVEQAHLLAVLEVGADERVAALDVAAQVGQGPLVKIPTLPL